MSTPNNPVQCPKCGWRLTIHQSDKATHPGCPKRGNGPAPVYVEVTDD